MAMMGMLMPLKKNVTHKKLKNETHKKMKITRKWNSQETEKVTKRDSQETGPKAGWDLSGPPPVFPEGEASVAWF